MPNLKFTKPINRRTSAPLEAPYDLKNARLMPYGEVEAVRGGKYVFSSVRDKPWVFWNGKVLDPLPSESLGGRLYQSDAKNGEFRMYPSDYAPPEIGYESKTPQIEKVEIIDEEEWSIDNNSSNRFKETVGVLSGSSVSYLAVPVSETDEAGPWFYFTYNAPGYFWWAALGTNTRDAGFTNRLEKSYVPEIKITGNDRTKKVELYRTSERWLDPFPVTEGDRSSLVVDPQFLVEGGSSSVYYHLTTLSFQNEITYEDNNFIPSFEMVGQFDDLDLYDEGGDFIGLSGIQRDRNTSTQSQKYFATFSEIDHNPTYYETAIDKVEGGEAKTATSNAIHNDGGVFYHAGATYPTQTPQVALLKTHSSGGVDDIFRQIEVAAQFEFNIGGKTVYGPVQRIGFVTKLEVAPSLAEAVLIYVRDGLEWALYERVVPNANGRFITSERDIYANNGYSQLRKSNLTFDYAIWEFKRTVLNQYPSQNLGHGFKEVTETAYEPHVALLSHQNRPLEVTYQQFSVPRNEAIRDIQSARLAEEEGLRSYDFYVFTAKGVYYGQRQNRNVSVNPVTSTVGLRCWNASTEESGFDAQRYSEEENYNPRRLAIETRSGLVFCGTDGRVYYLSGRHLTDITEDVPGMIGGARDVAYDRENDEVYVLDENRLWVYAFEMKGWVASYDLYSDDFHNSDPFAVGWEEKEGAICIRFKSGATYSIEGATFIESRIEAQPIGGEGHINTIEVDYDSLRYNPNRKVYWGHLEHRVESSGESLRHDLPARQPIYPRLRGWNHRLAIEGFTRLRSLKYET